ncbi:intracellular signaling protein [Idiomarina piscisalsi]|uniref:diguanylate cyclase n=1 Tax=Idiomarina piscisalsi TaxID=1096243 RepID=A0ABM6LQF0_9GAMM|nr:diguanylate cyclase [Idiomarina piscisalsi]ASG64740.1 intracellular signaling protein [Idiomarina piscisalsi]
MPERQLSNKILEKLPTMVAFIDEKRRYRYVNKAYCQFFSLKKADILGRFVSDVLDDESYARVKTRHDKVFKTGKVNSFSETVKFRDGRKCFLDVRYLPELNDENKPIGLYVVIEDVTEYYASVDLMRTIHEIIHKRGRRIDPASIDELLKFGVEYLDVDIGTASSIIDGVYTIEWIQTAKLEFDAGTQLPLDTTYCSVVLKENELVHTNEAGKDARFKDHKSFLTYGLQSYIGTPLVINDVVWGVLGFARKTARREAFSELEIEMVRMMGTAVETVIAEQAVRHDLIRQRDDMAAIAYTDSLTGLKNRSAGMQMLEQGLATHYKDSCCVVAVIDFDHFKSINDTYGHDIGDRVLIAGANAMNDSLRGSDTVIRVGGEEFMIILPHTDKENASTVLERVREAVETTVVTLESGDVINPTVSIGATASETNDDVSSIYRRADQALYKAKHAGRNCIVWSDNAVS